MTHTQLYITWGLLLLIVFAVASVGRQIELFREEFQEFREIVHPEEPDEYDPDPRAGSFD
jgi:biopolymer transport protein ExbB/TolQ